MGIAAALLLLAGVALASRWSRDRPADTAVVQQEDFRVVVEATGKLEAAVAYEVGPPSVRDFWEYNLTWMIPEGSYVKAGDVVARFDTTELDEQLREYQAELETTLQEKEKEQRNLDVALRELRLELVRAEGELKKVDLDASVPAELVSSIEIGQKLLEQKLARERVAFLSEKIEFEKQLVDSKLAVLDVKAQLYRGKIDYQEEAKRKFQVPAPTAGLVVYIPKMNGDRWEVGEGVWMLAKILEVADVSTLQAEAHVLEVDSARLAPGQPATITVDAVPGLRLESTIAAIGRIVHERSLQDPSKVFDAILPFVGVDTSVLRPGMSVRVSFETAVLPDRLTIPVAAVRAAPDGSYWVELRSSRGIERRTVTLGERDGQRVVVTDGLAAGEVVGIGGAA
jgi:multidrug efflux pump subunit AcrA (membrane-fusion protein)